MAATLDADTVHAQLHTDLIINGLKKCLDSSEVPVEIKSNACTLANTLLNSKTDEFTQMLKDMNFQVRVISLIILTYTVI